MEEIVFNLDYQNKSIEAKIIVALERISESFRVALWQESKETNLSPIQIQILVFLLFHSSEKRKISYLAQEFNMTKATVSEAVKILVQKDFLSKETEVNDTRSFVIYLTEKGKKTAEQVSSFANILVKPINSLDSTQKEILFKTLLDLIYQLNQAQIIQVQRMCFACSFYSKEEGHYCNLLKKPLKDHELRLDCEEFEVKI